MPLPTPFIDHDYFALLCIAAAMQPARIVELGTGDGTSAQCIMSVAGAAEFVTCDIRQPQCPPRGFRLIGGEELFAEYEGRCDLLFVDTDPHSEEQTLGWLQTWVLHKLTPNGVALFHDTAHTGVGHALRKWVAQNPQWVYTELGHDYGMGLLRKAALHDPRTT